MLIVKLLKFAVLKLTTRLITPHELIEIAMMNVLKLKHANFKQKKWLKF